MRIPCGFVAETLRNDQSEKRPDSRIDCLKLPKFLTILSQRGFLPLMRQNGQKFW